MHKVHHKFFIIFLSKLE